MPCPAPMLIPTPHLLIKEKIAGMANDLLLGFDYRESEENIENRSIFFGFPSQGRFQLEKENHGFYIHMRSPRWTS